MPVNWGRIIGDLAIRLGSVRQLEEAIRILEDAERDLARLESPVDFWQRLGCVYDNAIRRRNESPEGLTLGTKVAAMIRQRHAA